MQTKTGIAGTGGPAEVRRPNLEEFIPLFSAVGRAGEALSLRIIQIVRPKQTELCFLAALQICENEIQNLSISLGTFAATHLRKARYPI